MKLFFRETGKGCPLIILHGLYGSSDNWMTFAKALGKYFKVYVPDQRNHGQSPHNENHSYNDLRDDLLEFIIENSIEKPVIIGHSMGGKVAMFFAAKFPEMIRALIVIDISPRHYNEDSEGNHGFLKHSDILRILSELPLKQSKTREDLDKALFKFIRINRIRQFLLKNIARDEKGNFIWKLNLHALRKNMENILSGLEKENIQPHNYPALFVKGALSDYLTENDFGLIRELYPNSLIQKIEGTGHWIHAEKPGELISVIVDFLKMQQLCN